MTPEALQAMLNGEELSRTIDLKTLVIDLVRTMPAEEIEALFWKKLPEVEPDVLRGYFFMKRS